VGAKCDDVLVRTEAGFKCAGHLSTFLYPTQSHYTDTWRTNPALVFEL